MKLCQSPLCTFCNADVESLSHLFWDCQIVFRFMQSFKQYCEQVSIDFELDKRKFLLGPYLQKINANDLVLLHLKFYIYRCRCLQHDLSLIHFLSYLKYIYALQREKLKRGGKKNIFNEIWQEWRNILAN